MDTSKHLAAAILHTKSRLREYYISNSSRRINKTPMAPELLEAIIEEALEIAKLDLQCGEVIKHLVFHKQNEQSFIKPFVSWAWRVLQKDCLNETNNFSLEKWEKLVEKEN